MSRLQGKVALVSGGARGIGAAIARALIAEGAKVVIGDVLDREGTALANELGASATFVHLDVTKRHDWEAAVTSAVKTYGRLIVLLNNTGIGKVAQTEEYSDAVWDTIIAINLAGVFNGIKAAIDALKRSGSGALIHPGIVRTPLSAGGPQSSMSHVAMGRVGEPIEIANLCVFLASDTASFSTGADSSPTAARESTSI